MGSQLPNNWEATTLGAVFQWGSGGTPKAREPRFYGGNIPWLNIGDLTDTVVYGSAKNITEEGLRESTVRYVEPGNVLVAMYGSIGKLGIAGKRLTTNQAIAFTKHIPNGVEAKFLFWFLAHAKPQLVEAAKGGTQQNISQTVLKSIELPLAPSNEQRRIVAKIEELFSELDNGVESLKAARAQLKTYRQSLLKAAFEGRLTEQWRRDHAGEIETADKFLQRIRAAREADDEAQLKDWKEEAAKPNQDRSRKPKSSLSSRYESGLNEYTPDTEGQASLPASWSWVRLGWVLARKPQNGRSVKSKAGGFPVLTLTALHGNALDMSKCKEGDWGIDDARPYIVNEGDFLIARGNGSKSLVGRGARAVRVEKQVAYPDTMIRVSPDERWMQTRFLSLLWESRVVRDQIESSARTTAGIYKINQQHIKDLVVPLPHNIEEQEYIADSLESALSACEYTEELIERGLERAEKLRQSILKRAFEGKLVPQYADDEPASALLERIRAEQEKEPKSGKGRRKENA